MLAIGIDLGGTKTNLGLIEIQKPGFKIKKRITISSPQKKEELVSALRKNIDKIWHKRVEKIGLALAGQIDFKKRLSICSPNIKILEKVPLAKILEKKLSLPVNLDNDANSFVLAENTYGAGKGKKRVAGLTLGTGIGGGLVLEDKLYHGAFTSASEFGHMIVDDKGRLCGCGQSGCLEAYASATAMIKEYERRTGFKKDAYSIQEEAEANLDPAKSILEEAAHYLAVGLVNIVNIIEPEIIVLGGGLSRVKSFIDLAILKTKKITRGGKTEISRTKLGTDAGMIGAALL